MKPCCYKHLHNAKLIDNKYQCPKCKSDVSMAYAFLQETIDRKIKNFNQSK